jgi:hypothetical protein
VVAQVGVEVEVGIGDDGTRNNDWAGKSDQRLAFPAVAAGWEGSGLIFQALPPPLIQNRDYGNPRLSLSEKVFGDLSSSIPHPLAPRYRIAVEPKDPGYH